MKRLFLTLLFCSLTLLAGAEMVETVVFDPPQGWLGTDMEELPEHIKAMVVGSGNHPFPPSINLSMEPFDRGLKEYLEIVKSINQAKGADWKDLGSIMTEAGEASLSQVDMESKWGSVKMMHVILVRDGYTYILTASALRDEFPRFYKDFFRSLRSLRFIQQDITN